jgi:hypothetical protein
MHPSVRSAVLLVLLILAACTPPAPKQKDFASVDEAVQALLDAAKTGDTKALLEMLGQDAKPLIESGDAVQDQNARALFVSEYESLHSISSNPDDGLMTLQVGKDDWPFPFPLVQESGRWHYDSGVGIDEVINRRVGRNELETVQSCLAYVDAQREYYLLNPEKDPLLHYARRLLSTPDHKDGLYWSVAEGEEPSPLGEEFAKARSEGYFKDANPRSEPFHGYLYRSLEAQGSHADGGKYEYVAHDRMIGGFALVAYPAEYGTSGVMTFIVSHKGVVYSKDLGADTARIAGEMAVFDPDATWKREAAD